VKINIAFFSVTAATVLVYGSQITCRGRHTSKKNVDSHKTGCGFHDKGDHNMRIPK
jgi:hypothetical protein